MPAQLADRCRTVRPFLELLDASPVLGAAAADRRVRRNLLSAPGIDQVPALG